MSSLTSSRAAELADEMRDQRMDYATRHRLVEAFLRALAEQESEPVGHLHSNGEFCQERNIVPSEWPVPLYAQPQQATPAAGKDTPLCTVTGNPCGTDTVPVGWECPSASGKCAHKERHQAQDAAQPLAQLLYAHEAVLTGIEFAAEASDERHQA